MSKKKRSPKKMPKKKQAKQQVKQQVKQPVKQTAKRQSYSVSNEAFITAWQGADSLQDVLKALSIPRRYASSRATFLRRKKVKLKHFKRPASTFDADKLNALAKKSLR